jgi:hypothetical protein
MLLVPTIPSTLSLLTFNQIMKFCKENNLDGLLVIPFFPWWTHANSYTGLSLKDHQKL